MPIAAILTTALTLFCIVHLFRTGRPMMWLFVILMVPVVGPLTGIALMPALSAAATLALGKVFIQHFEAGGTDRWAALATEADGSVSLFQSDGAAVEEYRLRKLDQMMAFDAGEYDLGPAK